MHIFSGMRQKILLFSLLISITPLLLVEYITFIHVKGVTESHIIDHLASIADLKKRELQNWVYQQSNAIINYSSDHEIQQLLMEQSGRPTTKVIEEIQTSTKCREIYITDINGKIVASSNSQDIGSVITNHFIQSSLKYLELHIDDYSTTTTGIPVIRFAAPIIHGENKALGVIVLEFDLNLHIFPTVNNWPGMGKTGETLIAKLNGSEVVFLNNLRHRHGAKEKLRIPLSSKNALPAIFASSGEDGIIRSPDYRGKPVIAVYKYIPRLNWGFVAKMDQYEAFESIRNLQYTLLQFTLVIVALIVVIALFVSNTIITPLQTIGSYSKKLAKGDKQSPLNINTGGEIGSLADSILRMEKDLDRYQKDLLKNEKLAAIGKLSGSVAHDIRNPLAAISNSIYFINTFLGKDIENEKFHKHMNIMSREINRANEIISDLLDFSRENTPHLLIGNITTTINKTIREITMPEHIKVHNQLSQALPKLYFDQSQVRRVLLNLIQNAIQAMPDGGELNVQSEIRQDHLAISITDTGEGIAKEHLKKIFEPLYTTKSKGVGLGLTISQTFIEKHHGQLECKSSLGEGTIVTILLPLLQKTEVAQISHD